MTDIIRCAGCTKRRPLEFFSQKNHTGERYKTCDDCRAKNTGPRIKCDQCEIILSERYMKKHMKSAHGIIRVFVCEFKMDFGDICGKNFSQQCLLEYHTKSVHEKIKNHSCTICDYKCSTNGNLQAHIATHDRIRPLACELCEFATSHPSRMREHTKKCIGQGHMSSGEALIKSNLEKIGVLFQREMRFDDCRGTNPLPFDFYLSQYAACIEYDGEQHFRPIMNWGGVEAFQLRQKHDAIKTEYCASKNIKLLRISYFEFDQIQELITQFLDKLIKNTGECIS